MSFNITQKYSEITFHIIMKVNPNKRPKKPTSTKKRKKKRPPQNLNN